MWWRCCRWRERRRVERFSAPGTGLPEQQRRAARVSAAFLMTAQAVDGGLRIFILRTLQSMLRRAAAAVSNALVCQRKFDPIGIY
jgi:hypothetical protein